MRQLISYTLVVLFLLFVMTGCDGATGQSDLSPRVQALESKVATLESKITTLETSLGNLSIKVVTGTTDVNGSFIIKHGIENYRSIVGAAFAICRKSRGCNEITSQTPDSIQETIPESDNWLYWNSQDIQGGIQNPDWGGQSVSVTIFYQR